MQGAAQAGARLVAVRDGLHVAAHAQARERGVRVQRRAVALRVEPDRVRLGGVPECLHLGMGCKGLIHLHGRVSTEDLQGASTNRFKCSMGGMKHLLCSQQQHAAVVPRAW